MSLSVIISITEPGRQVARRRAVQRQDLVALHVVVVGGRQREGPLVSPILMVISGGASL